MEPIPQMPETAKTLTPAERAELDKFIGPGCEMYLEINYEKSRIVCGWGVYGIHYRIVSTGNHKIWNEDLAMFKTEEVDIDSSISVSRQTFTSVEIQKGKAMVKEHPEAPEETEMTMYALKLVHIAGMILIPTPSLELANHYKAFHWNWMNRITKF
jgi:hypothetical protein